MTPSSGAPAAAPAADIVAAAQIRVGPSAWPGATEGEPMFAEPWEGRAFALAFDVIGRRGRSWDDFRDRLIDAIAEAPARPYFESWVIALERLVVEDVAVPPAELHRERAAAATYRYADPVLGEIDVMSLRVADGQLATVLAALGDEIVAATQQHVPHCRFADVFTSHPADGAKECGVRLFAADGSLLVHIPVDRHRWSAAQSAALP
jgi:hypothetical protein